MKMGNATKGVSKLGGGKGKKSGMKKGNPTMGVSKMGTSGHKNTNAYMS